METPFSLPWPGVVTHYRSLPDLPPDAPVTLFNAAHPSPASGRNIGGSFELWLKYEGLNPTGTFKDQGTTAAISQAVHQGAKAVICASTGDTVSLKATVNAIAEYLKIE